MEEAVAQRLCQGGQRPEVGVIALALAGHRGVDGVVDVVVPLRGHPVAVVRAGSDHPRVVEVTLGDQRQRPAQLLGERVGFGGQLLEDVDRGGVEERMHGVQAQAVGVEVAHPAQRAVDDVAAHLVGSGVGDVDAFTPRVTRRRQVGPEPWQVVARRAEVVEHRVDQHAQAAAMAGVDESDQPVGSAVGFVHRVPQHAVVAPAVRAGKRVDRHHLDEIDAEIDQIVELFDRRVEGARRRERADVQLVDHRALHRTAGPAVRPSMPGARAPTAASVRAPRRAGAATAGRAAASGRRRADTRSARPAARVDGGPPPAIGVSRHRIRRAVDVEADRLRFRCPHREFTHRRAPTTPPATRRTTRRPASSR